MHAPPPWPSLLLLALSISLAHCACLPAGKNCSCPACLQAWGGKPCPDLYSVPADLVRPNMTSDHPGPGKRVRQQAPGFEATQAYHALYLPPDWSDDAIRRGEIRDRPARFPVIVEWMGNGPWTDGADDFSSGRPEDSNLGYGLQPDDGGGRSFIWISMPFLTSNLGNQTKIETMWWGCPQVVPKVSCGKAFDPGPTVRYLKSAVKLIVDKYGGDPANIIAAGWSRGAIAASGAIALYDDEVAKLWRAFVPYSHLDGDCGFPDQTEEGGKAGLLERYRRLGQRPMYAIGECDVAIAGGRRFLRSIGVIREEGDERGSGGTTSATTSATTTGTTSATGTTTAASRGGPNITFDTTGFENHNDRWILRPSAARTRVRRWLQSVLVGIDD